MSAQGQNVALVTGASSGIGAACAAGLARAGYRVIGASRTEPVGGIEGVDWRAMDVRSRASVDEAVAGILAQKGRIDLVVQCAGYSLVGAVEDSDDADITAQLDTNLTGAWRVARAILPVMRAQGDGCILLIGSIGGSIGLPFQAGYSASKFALAGFAEALSAEVRDLGIRVVLVEPGNYRTPINQRRVRVARADERSAYDAAFTRALATILIDEARGHDPAALADRIVQIAGSQAPKLRYRVGPWMERLAPLAKALLPGRLFERILIGLYL